MGTGSKDEDPLEILKGVEKEWTELQGKMAQMETELYYQKHKTPVSFEEMFIEFSDGHVEKVSNPWVADRVCTIVRAWVEVLGQRLAYCDGRWDLTPNGTFTLNVEADQFAKTLLDMARGQQVKPEVPTPAAPKDGDDFRLIVSLPKGKE